MTEIVKAQFVAKVSEINVRQSGGLPTTSSCATIFLDFDRVAVLTAWRRHQQTDLQFNRAIFVTVSKILLHIIETILFGAITVGTCVNGEKGDKLFELLSTLVLLLVTSLLTIMCKLSFQRNLNKPATFLSKEIGGLWNAMLATLKPFNYFRAISQRKNKLVLLAKELVHGETVTEEQFKFVLKINREELVDTRDDFYEAFIHRIPMAFLQFYLFSYSPDSAPEICSQIDVLRFILIVIYLLSTVQSCLAYEWKRLLYADSLHVYGFLSLEGRYPVPKWAQDNISYFLEVSCITSSILSRFFFVCFLVKMNIFCCCFCVFLIYIFNYGVNYFFPTVRATTENLPLGVPTHTSNLVNRWINIFVGTATRFNELSKYTIGIGSCSSRIPLIFLQVISFLMGFLVGLSFVEAFLVGRGASKRTDNSFFVFSNGTYNETLGNETFYEVVNDTDNETINETLINSLFVCENVEEWSQFVQFVGLSISAIVKFLHVVCYDSRYETFHVLHFHWVMLYVHVITALAKNYYCRIHRGTEDPDEFFPPIVCLNLYKQILQKLLETESSNRVKLLARFLVLMGVDLQTLHQLNAEYTNDPKDPTDGTSTWWEENILMVLNNVQVGRRARYSEDPPTEPNLAGLPIEVEVQTAYMITEHIEYSNRAFTLCCKIFQETLPKEVTSIRLAEMIDLMDMSKQEVLSTFENNSVFQD